jgi:hypothetical protein
MVELLFVLDRFQRGDIVHFISFTSSSPASTRLLRQLQELSEYRPWGWSPVN